MLELINITKSFQKKSQGHPILKNINLYLDKNEFTAIVGPSGSGKTTLMNIIGLMDRPTSGEYYLFGENISEINNQKRTQLRNLQMGFIFQSFMLLPRLTALQNVGLPLFYRGVERKILTKQAMSMLKKVGLDEKWNHYPAELSGGQQQRIAIARALIGKPSIILADEPTGALDTQTGKDVLALLKQIHQEEKATVLIITHDPSIAEQCTRVITICDGQITQ